MIIICTNFIVSMLNKHGNKSKHECLKFISLYKIYICDHTVEVISKVWDHVCNRLNKM